MRRLALVLTLVLGVGAAAQTTARGTTEPTRSPAADALSELKAKVDTLLGGYEYIPTEADWKPLGPEALVVLEQIAADPAQLPTRRSRAVACMALVDSPKATGRLELLVADKKLEQDLRATAAQALSYRAGGKALGHLVTLLNEEKAPQLRDAAARAIGRIPGPESKKALEVRLGRESDGAVRAALQQSLANMQP